MLQYTEQILDKDTQLKLAYATDVAVQHIVRDKLNDTLWNSEEEFWKQFAIEYSALNTVRFYDKSISSNFGSLWKKFAYQLIEKVRLQEDVKLFEKLQITNPITLSEVTDEVKTTLEKNSKNSQNSNVLRGSWNRRMPEGFVGTQDDWYRTLRIYMDGMVKHIRLKYGISICHIAMPSDLFEILNLCNFYMVDTFCANNEIRFNDVNRKTFGIITIENADYYTL